MERKKTGRPSKGPRIVVRAAIPIPLREAVGHAAAARGLTVSDYMAELMAADTGVPYTQQGAMPLAQTA